MRRTQAGFWLQTTLALVLLAAGAGARTVHFAGQDVPVIRRAEVEYVALSSLVSSFGGRLWQVQERYIVAVPGDSLAKEREYVFKADSAAVRCAGGTVVLPFAPVVEDEQLYLPVFGLGRLFPGLTEARPVLRLTEVSENGDTVLVRLQAEGEAVSACGEAISGLEYRVLADADSDTMLSEQLGIIPVLAANGLVQDVRIDTGPVTAIHFIFRRAAAVRASADSSGIRIQVWPRPERRVRRIVLDPGHGGKDPGAVGSLGTLEKAVVLDVSLCLKKKLEAQGFQVLLTRSCDEYVSLTSRSKYANEQKADLFVSIHANAAPNRQACGFETYFLSEAKTDWERAVATRENAALEFEMSSPAEGGDELELILADLAQNEFLEESSELAACIQEKTFPLARIKDRGVRQANFFVLRDNYMPAVLVECGFLSNQSEEKLLRDAKHRDRLADGICQGIIEFVEEYEERINGT